MPGLRRRDFVALLGGAVAWPVAARAQQADRVRRVGVLGPGPDNPVSGPGYQIFVSELRKLGFTEGQNVVVDYHRAALLGLIGSIRGWPVQMGPRKLETNFDEFSACSDAEAVFGGVVCVSVLAAPPGVLRIVHMTNDRHRDHSDGCADD